MSGRAPVEKISSYPVASLSKRLLHLFREALDETLRPSGVTAAQLHVLATLEREPGISGASLARHCMVTPQTTQVLLRGIEANGWIQRLRHPENDRILLATLTPPGQQILVRCRAEVGKIYETMLADFSPTEARELEALLSRCSANLESWRPGVPPTR